MHLGLPYIKKWVILFACIQNMLPCSPLIPAMHILWKEKEVKEPYAAMTFFCFLPNLMVAGNMNRNGSFLKKKPNKAQVVGYLHYTGS